jgi:hypothetical protein
MMLNCKNMLYSPFHFYIYIYHKYRNRYRFRYGNLLFSATSKQFMLRGLIKYSSGSCDRRFAVPNIVKGRRRVLIDYRMHKFQVAILNESWD